MKLVSGDEVDDKLLIKISKKINDLERTKNVRIDDTTGWYSSILRNLRLAVNGETYDENDASSSYIVGIIDRNPMEFSNYYINKIENIM